MKYSFYYRDQSVARQLIDQYQISQLIVEPAFVDSSKREGGLLSGTTLRYLILSKSGADLGLVSANAAKFGLVVFPRGMIWKVLDKYTISGITQILLSPEVQPGSEEDVVVAARENFEQCYFKSAVPVLDTDEWKKRLFFPIGLTDDGNPYPLDKLLSVQL